MIDKLVGYLGINRYLHVDQEELTALELIGKTVDKTNEVVNEVNEQRIDYNDKLTRKTDLTGDHKGTWQGLNPTQTDIGIGAQVDVNTNDLKKIKEEKIEEITVNQISGKYRSIQSAIDYISSVSNKGTIYINEGVYEESLKVPIGKAISLIGKNKKEVIVIDNTGEYKNCPLTTQGDGYISNITFKSTHDNNNAPIDSLRGYAVHVDAIGEGTLHFYNCEMISNQNAAFGSGSHQGQRIILENCELTSTTPTQSTMTMNGALYYHNAVASGTTAQTLEVINCRIQSVQYPAIYINDANITNGDQRGSDATVMFYNNKVFCVSDKMYINDGIVKVDTPFEIFHISGVIKLREDSCLNNVEILNRTNNESRQIELKNNVTNFGNGFQPLTVVKDVSGLISLKGLIVTSSVSGDGNMTIIGNIPIRLRNGFPSFYRVGVNDGTNWTTSIITIEANGDIKLGANCKGAFVSIDCNWYGI